MRTSGGLPTPAGRRGPARRGAGLKQCQCVVLALTLMMGVCLFYVYLFTGLQRVAHPGEDASLKGLSPLEAPRAEAPLQLDHRHRVAQRGLRDDELLRSPLRRRLPITHAHQRVHLEQVYGPRDAPLRRA